MKKSLKTKIHNYCIRGYFKDLCHSNESKQIRNLIDLKVQLEKNRNTVIFLGGIWWSSRSPSEKVR